MPPVSLLPSLLLACNGPNPGDLATLKMSILSFKNAQTAGSQQAAFKKLITVLAALASDGLALSEQKSVLAELDQFGAYLKERPNLGATYIPLWQQAAAQLYLTATTEGFAGELAQHMVSSTHTKISQADASLMLSNAETARSLLKNYDWSLSGYVDPSGKLGARQASDVSRQGISCIDYLNLLTNLSLGINQYDNQLPGVAPRDGLADQLAQKPEYKALGMLQTPVLSKVSADVDVQKLSQLLSLYGSMFNVQVYLDTEQQKPGHAFSVYLKQGQYYISESSPMYGPSNEQTLTQYMYDHALDYVSYNFCLVDTPGVRPLALAKSASFFENLKR